jgi:hypothetical protein
MNAFVEPAFKEKALDLLGAIFFVFNIIFTVLSFSLLEGSDKPLVRTP